MSVRVPRSRSPLAVRASEIELDTSPPSPVRSPNPLGLIPDDLDLNNPRWSSPRYPQEDISPPDSDGAPGEGSEDDDEDDALSEATIVRNERKERWFALFVACLLSVGSHYGTHLLGPIKSRISREMGASNSQFSLLLAALSLNNTWTPLVGGLLTARLGTPLASIIATSFIFLGQAVILFFTGSDADPGSLRGMLLGIWIFSLGVSPLAVVQETIIVRYFSHHGLGLSLALGLVVGKSSSFVSAISSYPLSEAFGRKGPFVVSTLLAGMSFGVNILYCVFHYRTYRVPALDNSSSTTLDQDGLAAEKVVQRRRVRLANLQRLGDPFWLFILLNIFSGAIWSPFLNLAANLIQRRYLLSDSLSAKYASLLLAFSIVLYPLAGYAHDRYHSRSPFIVYRLFVLASCLTLACFVWLVLPVGLMRTPVPAMISFGAGHGFATLLLVLVAPGLVEREWVSTALGAHKSMESAATTLTQTLSGILLDSNPKMHIPTFPKPPPSNTTVSFADAPHSHPPSEIPPDTPSTHLLLLIFLLLNVFQLVTTLLLWRMASSRREATLASTTAAPDPDDGSALSASPENGYSILPKEEENEQTIDPSFLSPTSSSRPVGERSEVAADGPASDRTASSPSGSSIPLRKAIRSFSASSRRPLLDRRGSGRALSNEEGTEGGLGSPSLSWDERIRGRWFFILSIAFVLLVWSVFGGVAIWRLEGG